MSEDMGNTLDLPAYEGASFTEDGNEHGVETNRPDAIVRLR